jgi:hypothetical protein
MATVFKKCTTGEQRRIVRFLWAEDPNVIFIHEEIFPV